MHDELELEVTGLAHGGRGVARHDGYVVFVAGALPGDSVRAEVTKAKRRFAEARMTELVHPSSDRVPDACEHGGEPCPGAPWQGLPYDAQLAHKSEQVDDALRRIGGLDGFELCPIEPAGEQWRYRNKLEYSFGEDDGGELALGFHARGRWDRVVDVQDCKLASERNNAARNDIRDWAIDQGIPAYDRRAERGVLRNLAVREGRRTGQIQTRLVTSPAEFAKPPVDLHTVVDGTRQRHRRPHRGPRGGVPGGGAQRHALPDLPPRLLPDEHRDGRAPLRDRRRGGRAERDRAPLRPLLRDRDDGPRDGTEGR